MLLHIQCTMREAGGSAKKSEEKTRAGQHWFDWRERTRASPSGEARVQKKSKKRERMLERKDKEEKKSGCVSRSGCVVSHEVGVSHGEDATAAGANSNAVGTRW